MKTNIFLGLLMFGAYLTIDFLIFKYFIYNKKGLLQILVGKWKARNKTII